MHDGSEPRPFLESKPRCGVCSRALWRCRAAGRGTRGSHGRDEGLGFSGQKRERGTASGSPPHVFVVDAVTASAGTLPTVRTARAVWSFDLRMRFSRWSQPHLLSC